MWNYEIANWIHNSCSRYLIGHRRIYQDKLGIEHRTLTSNIKLTKGIKKNLNY